LAKKKRPKSFGLFGLGQGREETRREKQGAFREKEGLFFSSVKFDALEKKKFNAEQIGIFFLFRATRKSAEKKTPRPRLSLSH
jgi:hypothetical protein